MDELLAQLIIYVGEDYESDQDDFLMLLLTDARDEVVHAMYPHGLSTDDELTAARHKAVTQYGSVIRRIAQYHYDKQGLEGVINFSEAGRTATYAGGGGTPDDYFKDIIPVARIV